MLTRLLVFLCEFSPRLRRLLWRWWYNKLARQIRAEQWVFMNYGCERPPGTDPLKLSPADEPDRLCIQLYERVAANVDLTNAQVLEIGSGRGGGASYLAQYRKPRSVMGIDFSPEAVAFSKSRHKSVPNLSFQIGDAENLELPDDSFDAVVNVESSHCYGNVPAFFQDVARVLRPGVCFLFADLREPREMETLKKLLETTRSFRLAHEENITNAVIAALQAGDARKREMIRNLVPAAMRPLFNEFAAVSGGQVFENLQNGSLVYYRFLVRKTGD
jgi:SAM-dependent methyltransferase